MTYQLKYFSNLSTIHGFRLISLSIFSHEDASDVLFWVASEVKVKELHKPGNNDVGRPSQNSFRLVPRVDISLLFLWNMYNRTFSSTPESFSRIVWSSKMSTFNFRAILAILFVWLGISFLNGWIFAPKIPWLWL